MTTTKPPVLTDEELEAITKAAYLGSKTREPQKDVYKLLAHIDHLKAVLATAGADAVRDATLEEAALICMAHASKEGWHGSDGKAIGEAIRALKFTPAAVADFDRTEAANNIVRGCCESEPADPDQPDTVCIGVLDLQSIVDLHLGVLRLADDPAPTKPAAVVADSMPGWSHWETRIKALMQDMGMPNSHSAYQALAQLANEMGQAHAAAAPQAGQLSGNAGEVDGALLSWPVLEAAAKAVESSAQVWQGFSMLDAKTCIDAAIAASKGANHG